ncbi:Tap domain-containing protein [Trichophyton interdigitale]|nr:Tap domain-containing protein [Trichophyton interdigitale]KAG5217407.1 Tap domain-containing protein [Trichophyton interdigitale]KAG8205860.1 Tap domain-containing protein [Trichophyton interdigitale]
MLFSRTFLSVCFLACGLASPVTISGRNQPEGKVSWGPCDIANATLPIQCGTLGVPLDYTDSKSNETLNLQLLKVPAINGPSKGSILFNFGGPGLGARANLAGAAKILQTLTGGHHDLIAHDPRGTESTLTFSCFKNNNERLAAFSNARYGELLSPKERAPLGRLWSTASIFADICDRYPESNQRGKLISTAFTARDLMQIVDALEEDGLLRYWGLSYGTVLGATVAAMFPDRIDRMIIDGVVNFHDYYNGYDIEVWTDTDKVFSAFLQQCVKSPRECALARPGLTAPRLEKSIYKLLDNIKYQPLVFNNTLIDHSVAKNLIRPNLYAPPKWPLLSRALENLRTGNLTGFMENSISLSPPWEKGIPTESPFGIPCSEKETGLNHLDQIQSAIKSLDKESKLLGQVGIPLAMTCTRWKTKANERYSGDFDVKTKFPILVIGNTFDPATSFPSAQNASATFDGSVLLEHGGYGHTSLNHGSVCTGKAVKEYFMEGILPKPNTVCEPAYPPFAKKTWEDILDQI